MEHFNRNLNGLRKIAVVLLSAACMGAFTVTAAANDDSSAGVTAQPQGITVTGTVSGVDGTPLPGVAVVEQNTTNGMITGIDGSYAITVSGPESVLLFSFIGYTTQEITVAGRDNINVVLEESTTEMDEIVVVAYGTQRKSSVTGSISTLKSSDLKTNTSPNVNSMLQGKVAGVQVSNVSGKPGEAANILIRGQSSLTSDNGKMGPLWVIDGVVSGTGAQLNPSEIESMSILKDAGATALYGSRATNGVILVTTKSGRTGENRFDVNVKLGISQQHLANFKLMDGQELYDYTMSMAGIDITKQEHLFLADKEKLLAHDTDWFDFATKLGFSQNYTVSHTMGTDKVRNFLSGDFYNEQGTVKGYRYDRYSIRNNTDIKVNDRLSLQTRVAASYFEDKDKQHSLYSAMTYLPWDYPYNPDGTARTGKESDWYGRDEKNYVYDLPYYRMTNKQFGVNGSFKLEYRITDWLVFESNNNIGYRSQLREIYYDPRHTNAESDNGRLQNINYYTTTKYANQLFRFNRTFEQRHIVNAFLGYEYSDYRYQTSDATGSSIPIGAEVLDIAGNPYAVAGGKQENALQSAYFNANYTYDDRYNAQFSTRVDGSSKLSPTVRYGWFWTVGGAWSISNERFMEPVKWVDHLKLRFSYGSIGNINTLDNYSWMSLYTLKTNYNGIPAAFPHTYGNRDLTWEKCFETNIGLDGRIYNRLGITFDFYIKNTSDLIYYAAMSSLTGFAGQYRNIGSMKNTGFEVTLTPDIIVKKDFVWTASLNIGANKNRITELANNNADQFPVDSGIWIWRKGEDMYTYFLPEWAGVDPYSGVPLWYMTDKDTGERLLTGDIEKADQVISGSASPKFYGGIGTSISYKGFTLSALGNFMYGNKVFHAARQFYDNDGAYPTYNAMSLKSAPKGNWTRWEKPGDVATHPQAIWGGNNKSNNNSTRYIEDGSYFRLNNLTLAYDLPARLTDKIRMRNVQVYVSAENLFTITKFSGADVEVAVGKDRGSAAADLYPSVRRFSFGVNFSF